MLLLSTHSLDHCLWGGGSPIIPLLIHQTAYPSITPAGSVHKSMGDNVVRMWMLQMVHSGDGCVLA